MSPIIKIVVLGDSGVGKSSLLTQYVHKTYSSSYKATVGLDFHTQSVKVGKRVFTVQLWDTAGQERFQSLGSAFFRGSDGVILTYDVTNKASFNSLEHWKDDFIIQSCPSNPEKFPIVVVGNKCDRTDRRITAFAAEKFCLEHGDLDHFEASAKSGTNVAEAIECLVEKAVNNIPEEEDFSFVSTVDLQHDSNAQGMFSRFFGKCSFF